MSVGCVCAVNMLAHLPTIAGLLVPNTPLRQPMTAMRAAQPLAMAAPAYGKMLNLLNQWDDEEDGDSTSCMAGMELDFLAERVGECGEEQCEALLPELMDVRAPSSRQNEANCQQHIDLVCCSLVSCCSSLTPSLLIATRRASRLARCRRSSRSSPRKNNRRGFLLC